MPRTGKAAAGKPCAVPRNLPADSGRPQISVKEPPLPSPLLQRRRGRRSSQQLCSWAQCGLKLTGRVPLHREGEAWCGFGAQGIFALTMLLLIAGCATKEPNKAVVLTGNITVDGPEAIQHGPARDKVLWEYRTSAAAMRQ